MSDDAEALRIFGGQTITWSRSRTTKLAEFGGSIAPVPVGTLGWSRPTSDRWSLFVLDDQTNKPAAFNTLNTSLDIDRDDYRQATYWIPAPFEADEEPIRNSNTGSES